MAEDIRKGQQTKCSRSINFEPDVQKIWAEGGLCDESPKQLQHIISWPISIKIVMSIIRLHVSDFIIKSTSDGLKYADFSA